MVALIVLTVHFHYITQTLIGLLIFFLLPSGVLPRNTQQLVWPSGACPTPESGGEDLRGAGTGWKRAWAGFVLGDTCDRGEAE